MNMKKNLFPGLWRCAAVAAGVVVCASLFAPARISAQNPGLGGGKTSSAPPITLQDVPAKRVEEYVVKANEIIRDMLLTGELNAARAIRINAPRIQNTFGSTIAYLAEEGAIVKAGERIVEFDATSLINSRADAELSLETARFNVAKRKVDLEANRCDRLNSVAQAEAAVKKAELDAKVDRSLRSENDYARYQLTLSNARLNLDKAREELGNFEKNYDSEMALVEITRSQRELELRRIDNDIAQLSIDAVLDGIFIYGDNWQSNRKVQVGDSIFPGMEVASIPDLTSMQVIGYVYDTEYRLLKAGMRCDVSFDALPGVNVGGSVVSLTDVASRRGFSTDKKLFQATIRLDEVDHEILKPGMTARVNVPLLLANAVPAVPRAYVGVDSQGRNYVLKGTDIRSANTQFVNLGAIGDSLIEIASGVSVGEKLFPVQ
ncbi:MAG: efflux RND transporter periplasmic adaptor subunit [Acidobacteriota bacterium]|jgi:multidrug efflux pump subunit AcrA (membrane-fusion protein)|nr:efflux RND transporter periplasmic adaptor subunit [Acidobacteriota bacterium]